MEERTVITLSIDGQQIRAEHGELLAAVLLREARPVARRHPVDGTLRAPYCMMGVCFECLVEIDGRPGQQACLVEVAQGMDVQRRLD